LKAIKDNKVYEVNEETKKVYLAKGFDIVDDNFNVIERSPTATVPYREYEKLLEENNKLREDLAQKKK
jgi:hypothetical protein